MLFRSEEKYDIDYGAEGADGLRIVHLTDVVYENGSYRSVSFVVNGLTCRSNMIRID